MVVVDWRSRRREIEMRLKRAGRMKDWVVIHVEVVEVEVEMGV